MNSVVSIVSCAEYHEDAVYEQVKKAIDLAGGIDVRGKRILLKPNMLSAAEPDRAVTTHPVFAKAVVRVLKEKGAELYMGDAAGLSTLNAASKKTGLKQVCEETGIRWVDFTEADEYDVPQGKVVRNIRLVSILKDIDGVVCLPKLKTHQFMYYTGAMKNLFGLMIGLEKAASHVRFPDKHNFAKFIVDIVLASKHIFSIMDGIVGMEGPGPGNGYPKHLGFMLASSNILALDSIACSIIGYDPLDVPIVKDALERGIWLSSLSDIQIKGESIEAVKPKDFKLVKIVKEPSFISKRIPPWLSKLIKNIVVPKPYFPRKNCIKCGECIEICSSKALQFRGEGTAKHVGIDYDACIRCYCCHEICPADAVRVKRSIL